MAEEQELLERRGIRKWRVKIHPFHLPWIRACSYSEIVIRLHTYEDYGAHLRLPASLGGLKVP